MAHDDVLRALLDTEDTPQRDVPMKRLNTVFRIQAIDGKTINRIREQATYPVKGGTKMDEEKFGALVIEKACVNVPWSDKALLDKYGVSSGAEVIGRRLLAGEIARLTAEILDLSGFNDDAFEEAKN